MCMSTMAFTQKKVYHGNATTSNDTIVALIEIIAKSIESPVTDGSSAIGFKFNTQNLTNSGSKLFSILNHDIEQIQVNRFGGIKIGRGTAFGSQPADWNQGILIDRQSSEGANGQYASFSSAWKNTSTGAVGSFDAGVVPESGTPFAYQIMDIASGLGTTGFKIDLRPLDVRLQLLDSNEPVVDLRPTVWAGGVAEIPGTTIFYFGGVDKIVDTASYLVQYENPTSRFGPVTGDFRVNSKGRTFMSGGIRQTAGPYGNASPDSNYFSGDVSVPALRIGGWATRFPKVDSIYAGGGDTVLIAVRGKGERYLPMRP